MKPSVFVLIPILAATLMPSSGQGGTTSQRTNETKLSPKEQIRALKFTTAAYRKEALRLVIDEANRVAKQLQLPEQLPITQKDLVGEHISPPQFGQRMGTIGNITTSNYVYYFSVGKKFSFLTRTYLEKEYAQLEAGYLWPVSRMDTNGAYSLATQFLTAVSMDVTALNRDCSVRVAAFIPRGKKAEHFVPVYWVDWVKGEEGQGSVASVELFEPTKMVRQLHVTESNEVPTRGWTRGGEPEKEKPPCPRTRKPNASSTTWSSRSKPCNC